MAEPQRFKDSRRETTEAPVAAARLAHLGAGVRKARRIRPENAVQRERRTRLRNAAEEIPGSSILGTGRR